MSIAELTNLEKDFIPQIVCEVDKSTTLEAFAAVYPRAAWYMVSKYVFSVAFMLAHVRRFKENDVVLLYKENSSASTGAELFVAP